MCLIKTRPAATSPLVELTILIENIERPMVELRKKLGNNVATDYIDSCHLFLVVYKSQWTGLIIFLLCSRRSVSEDDAMPSP